MQNLKHYFIILSTLLPKIVFIALCKVKKSKKTEPPEFLDTVKTHFFISFNKIIKLDSDQKVVDVLHKFKESNFILIYKN